MRIAEHFIAFFATSLINSIILSTNVRFYLSYDIKTILKSHFWCEKCWVLQYAVLKLHIITFLENL